MGDTSKKPAVRPAEDENSVVQELSILLRDGRLDRGESIEEVARTLRINRRYLEAIEDGRFEELPGPVYAIGFIRSFGDHVGLDGEELVRRFKAVSTATRKRAELEFPEPIPESGVPGGAILFAGLLVAVLAYGGWYMMSADENILSELVAPVPEDLAGPATDENADVAGVETTLALEDEPAVAAPKEAEAEAPPQDAGEEIEASQTEVATQDGTALDDTGQADQTAETVAGATDDTAAAVDEIASTNAEDAEPVIEVAETDAAPEPAPEPAAVAEPEPEPAVAVEPEPVSEAVVEPEPVAEPEPASEQTPVVDVAPVSEEVEQTAAATNGDAVAQSLNEQQLQAMQTGMIDAPTIPLEGSGEPEASEPAAEEETQSGTTLETAEGETAIQPETAETAATDQATDNVEQATVEPAVSAESVDAEGIPREGVVIVAREDSWIEVRDTVNNDVLVSRILRARDHFSVPRSGEYELATGNAGAIDFFVDGEKLPPLGSGGQIGRNIRLDADSLLERTGGSGR